STSAWLWRKLPAPTRTTTPSRGAERASREAGRARPAAGRRGGGAPHLADLRCRRPPEPVGVPREQGRRRGAHEAARRRVRRASISASPPSPRRDRHAVTSPAAPDAERPGGRRCDDQVRASPRALGPAPRRWHARSSSSRRTTPASSRDGADGRWRLHRSLTAPYARPVAFDIRHVTGYGELERWVAARNEVIRDDPVSANRMALIRASELGRVDLLVCEEGEPVGTGMLAGDPNSLESSYAYVEMTVPERHRG